jgi:hypothetical protein
MTLKDRIREDRERQKGKESLPETAWTVVAAIVQRFDLRSVPGAGEPESASRAETRPSGRLSLFPLLTPAQWRLTKEIVARFDNPYLIYVRSPEEIGLSRRLYERRPDLGAADLQGQFLEQLWRRLMAREGQG